MYINVPFTLYNVVLQTESKYGQALNKVKVGSRVGTLIDDTRCVHLYVDGKDQGIVFRGVKQPCYVLIDLVYYLKKVRVVEGQVVIMLVAVVLVGEVVVDKSALFILKKKC